MLPIKNNHSTLPVSTIKKATRAQLHLIAMIELDKLKQNLVRVSLSNLTFIP